MERRDFVNRSIHKYVGSLDQVAGVKRFEFKDGKAKGVEAFEVRTGGGLNYTVLADRCLDIAWAEYKGTPFSYISNTGVVAPQFFEPEELGYFRSFTVGFLSTCGLTYFGAPCTDEGQRLGLHGRIGNTPAEEMTAAASWDGPNPKVTIGGKVKEAAFFGEYLVLHRKIESPLGENRIIINDVVVNEGYQKTPLMVLYHVNFGYPLLQPGSEILAPIEKATPRDPRAEEGLARHKVIEEPQRGFAEQVYYWDLARDAEGWTYVALVNEELGFGVYEKFRPEQLPRFFQWKQMGEGYYVLGLEPANCFPEGRDKERERGTLQFLDPGEKQDFTLELGILEGREEINRFRQMVEALS